MAYNQDPWSWVDQQKPVAPLAMQVQPSQDQAPSALMIQPDPTMQQLQGAATAKGIDTAVNMADKGVKALTATAPLSSTVAANTALGTELGLGAANVAAAANAAAAAGTAAGAGAAGTVAATNAWNPVGWAAMAYLGGKALKLW